MLTRTSGTNLGANYAAEITATFAAGKTDVRIEESQSPPFVYPVGATDYAETEPNTIQDSYKGCGWNDWNTYGTDRQWLDMIFKFASAQKMTSAAIFYTFPFFTYATAPVDKLANRYRHRKCKTHRQGQTPMTLLQCKHLRRPSNIPAVVYAYDNRGGPG
ncbi:MAG: hypothetical protein ABSG65_20955 [Bryobacteraceae bacterium]